MPQVKKPSRLSELCLTNVALNIRSYWLKAYDVEDAAVRSLFETLNDDAVHTVLRTIFLMNKYLSEKQFLLLFHSHLKKIDLSFIANQKSTLNSAICSHIGINCVNLVELNLFAQKELTPKNLVDILRSLRKLRRLDLSHTNADHDVCTTVASTCQSLTHLSLDSCKNIADACVDLLVAKLSSTLTRLSLDNLNLSDQCVNRVLVECERLTYFQCENLVKTICTISANDDKSTKRPLKLDTLQIDSAFQLRPELIQAVSSSCPILRRLTIHSIDSTEALEKLGVFSYLIELVLANTDSLTAFSFEGALLSAIRSDFGKQLRKLDLICVEKVNLRSIVKHCPNLQSLRVEFRNYYEPAPDESLYSPWRANWGRETTSAASWSKSPRPMENLTSLTLANPWHPESHVHSNIDQFKKDIELLISNCRLKCLQLRRLDIFDDEFMLHLFTRPVAACVRKEICLFDSEYDRVPEPSKPKYAHQQIERLELRKMHNISIRSVKRAFFSDEIPNVLKVIVLNDCKRIRYSELAILRAMIHYRWRYDCQAKWT